MAMEAEKEAGPEWQSIHIRPLLQIESFALSPGKPPIWEN